MYPQQFILTSSLFFGGKFIFLAGDFKGSLPGQFYCIFNNSTISNEDKYLLEHLQHGIILDAKKFVNKIQALTQVSLL